MSLLATSQIVYKPRIKCTHICTAHLPLRTMDKNIVCVITEKHFLSEGLFLLLLTFLLIYICHIHKRKLDIVTLESDLLDLGRKMSLQFII